MSLTVTDMQRHVAAGLSMRTRAGYTLVLVAGIGMTAVTASLLGTEPHLPARTQLSFAVLTLIGAAWTALAWWTLARRHVLLAQHRIASSWLALGASALFLVGTLAFRPALPDAAIGVALIMVAGAAACLVRARRYRARLTARRDELVAAAGERR